MSRVLGSLLLVGPSVLRADSTVVFNELMYHPATAEPTLEWVEFYNQMAVDIDLSGWSISDGIQYRFPNGTILRGGEYLVVAISPATLEAASGLTKVHGPFSGRLGNSGERLELRDNNQRVMDAVRYGTDGDWPVAPDGGGPSLAKRSPNAGSASAASWAPSAEVAGTPGAVNFPPAGPTGRRYAVVEPGAVWRYNDSGRDLGTAWREPAYDDSPWATGPGPFQAGHPALEPPAKTALAGGATTYYFRVAFEWTALAGPVRLEATHWLDDGAVFYLNGTEVLRWNLPGGPIDSSTTASSSVARPEWQGPFELPVGQLVSGRNVLAVEVHQGPASLGSPGLRITPAAGVAITWDGNDGDFYDPEPGAAAPANVAFASQGAVAFGSSQYDGGGIHLIGNVNDGLYGNSHSWLANFPAGDPNPFVGLRFTGTVAVAAIAWGRDNGNNPGDCCGGQLNDRWAGTYTVQYTRVAAPGMNTPETGNAATGWAQLGTFEYLSAGAGFTPWLRHRFEVSAGDRPISLTGLRIKVSDPNLCIDELEVFTEPAAVGGDIAFGAELEAVELVPPPPPLVFNESAAGDGGAGTGSFWVELLNHGATPVPLGDCRLTLAGSSAATVSLPEATVEPGGLFLLEPPWLTWTPRAGDRLFLYGPGGRTVLDAAVLGSGVQARAGGEAGVPAQERKNPGSWRVPAEATPGAPNRFEFQTDIVINEILYHPRAIPASPARSEEVVLVPLDAEWRYQQEGRELGTAWRAPDYDDRHWPAGPALLGEETAALPAPIRTPLELVGQSTYYFRTTFVLTGEVAQAQLTLRTVLDDGAVLYLNGTEVYRSNLPEDPLTYATLASSAVSDAVLAGPFTVPADELIKGTNVLAVEVHQVATDSSDVVFGAELSSVLRVAPAVPYHEPPGAFVELYNRGTNAVDLTGWRFTEGIDFAFAPGTTLGPGGYLVIAQDAAYLRSLYPGVEVTGEFRGRLSRAGELLRLTDAAGNPADEVRYFESFPWPEYADGGGSSLELRDPRADNSKAEAWSASDESGKSTWRTYQYRGTAAPEYPNERWNEFVAGLFGPGEVLLDDISVVESPGGQALEKIPNGSFGAGATGWRPLGNHGRSRAIADPGDPGNRVLHLIATGETEDRHNHLEVTFLNNRPVVNGREYQVSFRAKWLAGANRLNTRLYFNRLARRLELDAPRTHGTPGGPNSRLEPNIGPTYAAFQHQPVVPAPGETVAVTATASDPDGAVSATLWWSVNGGAWKSAPMVASPRSADTTQFAAQIPGQSAGAQVQFYLEGRDARGVSSTFPAAGRESRALFHVQDGQAGGGRKHTLRILMTPGDVALLHAVTNVMSNEYLGATLVYDESETFYDAGVRLKGSMAARPNPTYLGFNLRFPPDHLFRGVHAAVSLDRSGRGALVANGQEEILIKQLMLHAGGIPGMYDDLVHVVAPRASETGPALLLMAEYGDVFLESQFTNGTEGTVFNYDLVYQANATVGDPVTGLKVPLGYIHPGYNPDLENLGDDPETYRWSFRITNNRDRDDYSRLIEFLQAMSLQGDALDRSTRELMDVDEWLRLFAAMSLTGVGSDIYSRGLNHNLRLYIRPSDRRVLALPWDMDNSAFGLSANAPLWGSGNFTKVIVLPRNQRLYYGHLLDLIGSSFNTNYLAHWTAHYTSLLPGQDFRGALSYLGTRNRYVQGQIPARVPFQLTTNGGRDFMVDATSTVIGGVAWFDVKTLRLDLPDAPLLDPTWTTPTAWRVSVPLLLGANSLRFLGYGFRGDLVASNQITVTCTVPGGGADSDGDGLPDLWEQAHGLSPNEPDGDADPDGDGRSNRAEYLSGTDPRHAASYLRFDSVVRDADGVALVFTAEAGRSYTLEAAAVAGNAGWTGIRDFAPVATNRVITVIEPAAGPVRLYRLVTPQIGR